MENATKAIIMVASFLIGIMILSLAVYLFVSFGASSAEINNQIETDRINQFNVQFTVYDGKEVDIYEVVTIANLATDNNINFDFGTRTSEASEKDMFIQVNFKPKSATTQRIENKTNEYYNKLIYDDLQKVETQTDENGKKVLVKNKYKCKVDISSVTQRVYKVTFTQI